MRFDILTLYPKSFENFFDEGLMGKAVKQGVVSKKIHDLRSYGLGSYRQVDDSLFGGGSGMLLRYDVLSRAMEDIYKRENRPKVVLMSPRGRRLNQKNLQRLAKETSLCIVCPAFEGLDERFTKTYVDEEISIGDYVLNRGEIPAMVLIEGLGRLQEGYLGDALSIKSESFSLFDGSVTLEEDHYTKPFVFNENKVPELLEKGHHEKIENWRRENRLIKTFLRRSDLFFELKLKKKEIKLLESFVFKKSNVTIP